LVLEVPMQRRREFERVRLEHVVEVSFPDAPAPVRATTRDLSAGGASVLLQADVVQTGRVQLRFCDGRFDGWEIPASIIRVAGAGAEQGDPPSVLVGCAFSELEPGRVKELYEYLYGQPCPESVSQSFK
jgi:c-di-GMP-binding flagellar brake protein YcgR